MNHLILNEKQCQDKMQRMACQMAEECGHVPDVILIGISGNGSKLATLFGQILLTEYGLQWPVHEIKLNKAAPLSTPISCSMDSYELQGKTVLLIDDVQNSGRTLMHASSYLASAGVVGIKAAVLVDRQHNAFPIKVAFAGLSLATTLQDHIRVEISQNNIVAFLE